MNPISSGAHYATCLALPQRGRRGATTHTHSGYKQRIREAVITAPVQRHQIPVQTVHPVPFEHRQLFRHGRIIGTVPEYVNRFREKSGAVLRGVPGRQPAQFRVVRIWPPCYHPASIMITVTCPHCQTRILVPATVQGREGVCFGCGRPLQVPKAPEAAASTLQFEPGALISERYRLEEPIGKGGMGVVYRAHDTLVDEPVALKFLNPAKLRNQRSMALFIKEAQIARRLRHDNIVAVHDVSTTREGVPFLTMELVTGPSLRAYLRRRRAQRSLLPIRIAIEIALQILAALEYAHRFVIHRDLKPENVLLLTGERVKVLDFGLALALGEAPAPESAPAGRVVGTIAYASPEQRLHKELDHRSDLYSLGLILRELLTLRTPAEEIIPVEKCRDDVPAAVRKVLHQALQQSPNDRWQTAAAFRAALQTAFDEAYQAQPATTPTGEGAAPNLDGMILLKGGSIVLGNGAATGADPDQATFIEDFYMDAYPVTVGQYREFIDATGHAYPALWGQPNYSGAMQPVIGITWHDATAYAHWAGKTLPTEAQWEYAARGKDARPYPWGHTEPDPTRANYGDNVSMPSIVSMHEDGATPEGIQELAGNVWEWTADPFDTGPEPSPRKAIRGGCWQSPPAELRATYRKGAFPHEAQPTIGFRCVAPART